MGKGRIVWLIHSKVQVQIDKSCHQVGLSSAHGKAKQVVSIRNIVESLFEKCFIIDAIRGILDLLLDLSGYLISGIILQTGVFKQRCGRRVFLQKVLGSGFQCDVIKFQGIELSRAEQISQRLTIAGNFEKEIGFDSVDLSIPHLTSSLDISKQVLDGTLVGHKPTVAGVGYHFMKHGGVTSFVKCASFEWLILLYSFFQETTNILSSSLKTSSRGIPSTSSFSKLIGSLLIAFMNCPTSFPTVEEIAI